MWLPELTDADFGGDQMHGTNAFIHDGYQIFRTYCVTACGPEPLSGERLAAVSHTERRATAPHAS